MSESDLGPVPALPDRARPVRWGYYAVRVGLVLLLLAVAALLPTGGDTQSKWRLREGDISRDRLVAPYDFRVQKDEISLRREQELASLAVPPVFVADQRAVSDALARYALFQDKALGLLTEPRLSADARALRMRALGVTLPANAVDALGSTTRARRVLEELSGWLVEISRTGVVAEKKGDFVMGFGTIDVREAGVERPTPVTRFVDREGALESVRRRAQDAFRDDPPGVTLAAAIAAPFIQPTLVYDRGETEWRRNQAEGAVTGVVGTVKKNELLVDANERVTHEAVLKLQTLRRLEVSNRGTSQFLYPPVARMLLMLLFLAAFLTYLRMELPTVYRDNGMLALFVLLTVVVLSAAVGLVNVAGLGEFTVPLAIAPLVVASLLEKRPALVFTLMLSVLVVAIAELRAPFVAVALMGGVTATYSVSRLRHRLHFVRAFFAIALANLAAILAWDLARSTPGEALLRDAGWGAGNAFLATSLAFLLLPLVEHVFRLTSDVTLLELSDLNRPLLRRLQLEAPGTYHHSMVVGSLAEAAAEAVGANSLLARVSAYYHDIGKLSKPEYYAENEPASSRSRHEKLTPSMSSLVVKSHITEGLEMARKYRLPRAVRDSIPEHHGTMVMAFFYHKALEADATARREDYSYPGPRPRSKETAILMLADGVEGASRALAEPTPSRIRGLVQRLIDERVRDGQLDESNITLQELARVREAFIPVLTAIFHVRVPYPEAPRREGRRDESRRES